MPRARIHKDNAARQKAYRARVKERTQPVAAAHVVKRVQDTDSAARGRDA